MLLSSSKSLENEPGLLLANTVAELSITHTLPVLLVNTTCKTLSLRRGTPVAKVQAINCSHVSSVDKTQIDLPIRRIKGNSSYSKDFSSVDAPDEYKEQVINLLTKNSDLFTDTDAELSHTDTVKMKKDTGIIHTLL